MVTGLFKTITEIKEVNLIKNKFLIGSGVATITITGSLFIPSYASRQPASTTTINVQVPAPNAATAVNKDAGGETEIADLRNSNDIDGKKPAIKADDEAAKKSSSSRKPKSQLLDFYDRLPAKHFSAFGGANRRSLLNRKGAVVDYKHNFIEIPGSDNERDGDLEKLQITLFPNGNEPWCAVSRIVWPQGQTPGALDFYYGEADDFDRHPRTAAEGFFPYNLQRTSDGLYESAWLPQRGLDIRINSAQDAEFNGPIFHYNRDFRVGEPAFKQITEPEEG